MHDLSNSLHDLDNQFSGIECIQELDDTELCDSLKLKARQEVYDEIRHAFTLAVAANAAYLREIERLEANWAYANNKSNAFEKQCRFYATYAYDQHLNEQALKAEISKNISLRQAQFFNFDKPNKPYCPLNVAVRFAQIQNNHADNYNA